MKKGMGIKVISVKWDMRVRMVMRKRGKVKAAMFCNVRKRVDCMYIILFQNQEREKRKCSIRLISNCFLCFLLWSQHVCAIIMCAMNT